MQVWFGPLMGLTALLFGLDAMAAEEPSAEPVDADPIPEMATEAPVDADPILETATEESVVEDPILETTTEESVVEDPIAEPADVDPLPEPAAEDPVRETEPQEEPERASPTTSLTLGFGESFPQNALLLERLPPRQSYEFGLSMSYGTVAYWGEFVPSWVGFGLRVGGGKNFDAHRIGADLHLLAEGPVGVHTTLVLEPHLTWDVITGSGLMVGAGVGPALMYHAAVGESQMVPGEKATSFGPSALARIGWSQSWSRVGSRLFVFVEPKIRYARGEWNPLVALVVGSGTGI